MALKSKLLPINELKVGMISASDINFEDKVLLAKGVPITESALDKLKQNYIIDSAEVYLENDSDKVLTVKRKTAKELQDTFNEFSWNLKEIFTRISHLSNPEIEEIRAFSKKIQEEFKSVDLVIKNVVFYGSGKDTVYKHSINVAAISFILAKWLGFDEKDINLLTYSAVLHDFGKIKISQDILRKEGNMTSAEYETFKTHPVIGYNFVKKIPFLNPAVSYGVLMHHERMDGSGYPLHVNGDKIHNFAKVIAIADVFDQVSSNRYDEKIKGPLDSLRIIKQESFSKLDFNYCNIFLKHILDYYMGESVILNDKRPCKIIQMHEDNPTRPFLLADNGFVDLEKETGLYVQRLVI